MVSPGLVVGKDGRARCFWCAGAPDYQAYHDHEWGRPVRSDYRLFERICLEGFQAGLSWLTILRKRAAFRRAFANFNYHRVARYTARDARRLLADAGIVRHRGKISAAISNARCAIVLAEEFGSLAAYLRQYAPPPTRARRVALTTLRRRTQSPESLALSRDLRRRGWRFVGPTTMYALLQATGLVNDHLTGCWARADIIRRTRPRLKL